MEMSNQFVAVPSQDLESWLDSKNFIRSVQYNEVVYSRVSIRDPNVHLKVYTSIRVGSTSVRGAGKDAIRVCVIFDNGRGKSFGIGKFSPILRVSSVESVIRRIDERVREAATRGNEWIDEQEKRFSRPANQNAETQKLNPNINKNTAAYQEYLNCLGLKE